MATIRRDVVLDLGNGGTMTYDVDDVTGPFNQRFVWAPGTPDSNRDEQRAKLIQARNTFRTNYAQWGTMTTAQKDNANRQAQRAIANLIAYALEDMSDNGD